MNDDYLVYAFVEKVENDRNFALWDGLYQVRDFYVVLPNQSATFVLSLAPRRERGDSKQEREQVFFLQVPNHLGIFIGTIHTYNDIIVPSSWTPATRRYAFLVVFFLCIEYMYPPVYLTANNIYRVLSQ